MRVSAIVLIEMKGTLDETIDLEAVRSMMKVENKAGLIFGYLEIDYCV